MSEASTADLLVRNARLVATVDDARAEIAGGWVAVTNGLVSGVGRAGEEPLAEATVDATDCLVTPGLINTHHHLYQNLTRAYGPALDGNLFHWLKTLYPKWARLDEEAAFVSAWVGLAELAESGCTTSSDHLYVHPEGGGDLLAAEISAAIELGVRFHPTRGSMSLSEKDGGLPPDSVVQTDDTILAQSAEAVHRHHDPSHGAMTRIALAPCSPFSVTERLMAATAELAAELDVRLHTHLAEDTDEDDFCLEQFGCRPIDYLEKVGWASGNTWIAHCVQPNTGDIAKLGGWGVGVAHCPSSNMILGSGVAPVRELRAAGSPVGIGVDGSASADSGSMWTETRNAMLSGRLKGFLDGTRSLMSSRDALEMATRDGAACLGRAGELGELSVGAVGDIAVWALDGLRFAGAHSDPVEAWLRCGPTGARTTIVGGRVIVDDHRLVDGRVEDRLRDHRRISEALQK
ncbi:MAG: 8-oxoguanine deaminase [Actinobacteria bacterium]|nr:8-oxoguanine deaminase [Actinomycetota bacterium]